MPEPSWLGNAQAALLVAAIAGPATVWRRYRSWWVRGATVFACVFASVVVGYQTVKGNLGTLVPPFVLSPVPGWALMIAFAVGAT